MDCISQPESITEGCSDFDEEIKNDYIVGFKEQPEGGRIKVSKNLCEILNFVRVNHAEIHKF